MLMPKRVKYRKAHKPIIRGISHGASTIAFGEYALKCLAGGYITARQVEACRLTLTRAFKKGGKIWIRVFPDRPISRKPAETRMGKGKGDVAYWVMAVKAGRILFEVEGVSEEIAKDALLQASYKLPMRAVFVKREAL
ncbi:MAG: 50S ribosomal protein L16 [Elusimicrobiota bacterium]